MSDLSLAKMTGKCMVFGIRAYQMLLSPVFPTCCRFYPSCSEYAISAIRHHGPIKGFFLGVRRLLRCHPWHPGGYDPVK